MLQEVEVGNERAVAVTEAEGAGAEAELLPFRLSHRIAILYLLFDIVLFFCFSCTFWSVCVRF